MAIVNGVDDDGFGKEIATAVEKVRKIVRPHFPVALAKNAK
jgi:hypothetical protein